MEKPEQENVKCIKIDWPKKEDVVRLWVESQCSCPPLRNSLSLSHLHCLVKATDLCREMRTAQEWKTEPAGFSEKQQRSDEEDISWGESLDSLGNPHSLPKRREVSQDWEEQSVDSLDLLPSPANSSRHFYIED